MSLIKSVEVTPIAFRDPPLLNVYGIHEAWALRTIIEVHTEEGVYGLGESYGDQQTISQLKQVAPHLIGMDVFHLNAIRQKIEKVVTLPDPKSGLEIAPGTLGATTVPRIFSAYEVACLDVMGKLTGRPVCDLLGGKVRDEVDYSAYLFYKYERHGFTNDSWVDKWGEALTPEGIVAQAKKMIGEYGFQSIKLKAGVFEPLEEIKALKALREVFPELPLRIDPNGGWSVEMTKKLLPEFSEGLLQYLEDPAPGKVAMGEVSAVTDIPLATNMCVIGYFDVPEAIERDAVQVILSDHHYWGGLRATQELARLCKTWNIGLSMHSNSHLGISLMAMTHAAATIENLTYACDTHYPWQEEEVIKGGKIKFNNGAVVVPDKPGLGVELDREALAALAENYKNCGIRERNDVTEMQKYQLDWQGTVPRF
ncbi:glucarate dehydratase family protein [Marinomonas spartinae]|uniref:glucarate dehydratase family protein n=1 Tax=Marinomonas spartinae TaxID=1792290 RepID=UPI0018F13540|nr:glucarate dehydratase family protein [Marinomonas spartinae]MBJ7554086.1 glucarate dehydratase [Marinomonas spartinae]